MIKHVYLTIVTILVASGLYATTDKYRLTLRDNPATSIVVGWNQIDGTGVTIYYGTTDHGTDWASYPNSQGASRSLGFAGMNNHFARLTGLQPNTAYYFVIKDSNSTSPSFWFKTAPNVPTERLSFIAGGDSRNNRTPRRNGNRLVSKLKPHAVLFGGDMTNACTNSEWQEWFDDWQLTISSDGRMYPIVATRGNHETNDDYVYNLFDTPRNNSSVYYALTFGGSLVRVYTLNTEIAVNGNQETWLENDLAASSHVTWKTAQYHRPIRPHTAGKAEQNDQYNSWAGRFYNHNVNLVVECDAHTVKTTWPVRPSTSSGNDEGFKRDDANGTVFVGEGCWGAPLRTNNDDKSWTRNSGVFNQFKLIFVDQGKIEVRTIKLDNATSVGENTNENPFAFPSNLDIWSPSNGSVVTIQNSSIANAASFVSQNVPSSMIAGETATVSVTMQNTGTSTWTKSAQHKLGSQNPQDNTNWGMNRVFLDDADNIAPNHQKVFTFDITAPSVAGNYDFQWKMLQESVEWFGAQSANTTITVTGSSNFLDDCDALTGWSTSGSNSLTLSGTVQQGSNSVKIVGSGTNEFEKVFSPAYNSGLSPSNARLEFWYYVSDPAMMSTTNQVELGSGGAPDVNEYHWSLSNLTSGWNFISLDVSDAVTTGGTPDLNAIDWFRIYNVKSGSVTNRIDAIQLVQSGTEYLDDCDALTDWSTAGSNTLSLSGTVKQGSNSVKMIGSATDEFKKVFSPVYNSGLTASNARLEFWYYVSDPSSMSTSNQVELGSGGAPDVNEYHWNLSGFTSGWNLISLDVSAAGTTGGTPDLNAINWFRIYNSKSGSVTNRIDAIRLYDKTNARVAEVGQEMPNKQVLIYPNPTSDYVNIDLGDASVDHLKVEVYNLAGVKVMESDLTQPNSSGYRLSLAGLQAGVYVVKIATDSRLKVSRRLVIQ